MDLTTEYMGLTLRHPFMVGASPLVDDLDAVRRLVDAGSSAVVMHSMFEEQFIHDELRTIRSIETHANAFPEALSYFPEPGQFALGPEAYLEQVQRIKASVDVPVIASMNGLHSDWWLHYAVQLQEAGADALELNVYYVAANGDESGLDVEERVLRVARAVRSNTAIPIAVKLSPYFSSVASLARQLDQVGVDGLVLFNRFYQPDFDVDNMEVTPTLHLSDSSELLLRLRWTALLYKRVRASLALSGGVHSGTDAIKALMAGASVVQVVSAVLKNGPEWLSQLHASVNSWMEEHEYESLNELRGSLSAERCPDPMAFERANYMKILHRWRPHH